MNEMRHTSHRLSGLGYFCAIAAALILFFGVVSPRVIVANSPALQRYGERQEFYGIHSGALYYTDLKTQQETQSAVRHAMRRSAQ
jgi:hypothetical protein